MRQEQVFSCKNTTKDTLFTFMYSLAIARSPADHTAWLSNLTSCTNIDTSDVWGKGKGEGVKDR
ncbi:hypothetical protein Cha6605_4155 [Chamaesiphon minutus PCC 6605]|uniref:Uncharacterized protein n=1 Tax=Chamaesiphon minutus (strain ATCC 27169 / PCC 6605) TaxID=1173020 RepID=K9UKW0_CHAP6|nr:hypothetical protein Cha6605_4155 [Chamaesiphon minutus PCC 6605]